MASPKINDYAAWGAATKAHEQAGTQMTPTEAYKYGIRPTEYSSLYKDQSWYTPSGATSWGTGSPMQSYMDWKTKATTSGLKPPSTLEYDIEGNPKFDTSGWNDEDWQLYRNNPQQQALAGQAMTQFGNQVGTGTPRTGTTPVTTPPAIVVNNSPIPPATTTPTTPPATTTPQPQIKDWAAWDAASKRHEQAGTQMTPQEAATHGITPEQYSSLYKEASWYNPDGSLTSNAPYGQSITDQAGFTAAAERHRLAGTQMTPSEAARYGISPQQYGQIYGSASWYDSAGNRTALAPKEDTTRIPSIFDADLATQKWKNPEVWEMLFPSADTVNPEDYATAPIAAPTAPNPKNMEINPEASPLYQWKKGEGLDEITKMMASRGLIKSGAEAATTRKFLAQLLADESEQQRAQNEAQAEREANMLTSNADRDAATTIKSDDRRANIATGNADRTGILDQASASSLLSTLKSELDRWQGMGETRANFERLVGNDQYNKILQTLTLLLSQDPSSGATAQGANLLSNLGNQLGSIMSSVNPTTGVPPSGNLSNSNSELMKILMGSSNSQDWLKQGIFGLGSLFDYLSTSK